MSDNNIYVSATNHPASKVTPPSRSPDHQVPTKTPNSAAGGLDITRDVGIHEMKLRCAKIRNNSRRQCETSRPFFGNPPIAANP